MVARLTVGDWYYSVEINGEIDGCDRTDIVLEGLALVRKPGGVNLDPLTILPGDLDRSTIENKWHHLPAPARERLHRAAEQLRHRDHGLTVIDNTPRALELRSLAGRRADTLTAAERELVESQHERPAGKLRHSAPGRILRVR
jgi:hypothetical protein